MSSSHSLHLSQDAGRRDADTQGSDHSTEVANPGGPTRRGGQALALATVLMAALWIVSLIQVVRLPAQGPLQTSGEAAIWTALALASAISTFLLGVWKVHRS